VLALDFIRKHPELVENAGRLKGVTTEIPAILKLDDERVGLQQRVDTLAAEQNRISKSVPLATSDEERKQLVDRARAMRREIEALRASLTATEESLRTMLLRVPNIPSPDAPVGGSEANTQIRAWGEVRTSAPRDHVDLMSLNGWGDLEHLTAVSGTRSYMVRGNLALLEMALHRWAMEYIVSRGFEPFVLPSMARAGAFIGTGHFPDGIDEAYALEEDLYLTGTAEVVLNSLHSGDILAANELPKRYAGYSPCFRKESGSAGRDVRGLMRVHQFAKVEQYVLCEADETVSASIHAELLANAEHLLQSLELPYRVVECATGDMGLGKIRMHDIECWVPSQSQYRETHSCSSLGDWQARRANLRYRDAGGTLRYAYTLNNTAIATPRILVMLLENHQLDDGRVYLPPILRPYLGGRESIGHGTS
jgi:seryl-tRNA synthetase